MDKEKFSELLSSGDNTDYQLNLTGLHGNITLKGQLKKLPTNSKETVVTDNNYLLCVNITSEQIDELFESNMINTSVRGGRKSRKHRSTRKHRSRRNRNRS